VAPAAGTPAGLQAAIRAADPNNPAFALARVVMVGEATTHWAVLPGVTGSLQVKAVSGDATTLIELGLDPALGRLGYGVISGELPVPLPSRARALALRMEPATPSVTPAEAHSVTLPAGTTTAAGLASDLQTALVGLAGASAAFTGALVGLVDTATVLVVAGDADHIPLFGASTADPDSLPELGLESRRPAMAGNLAMTLGGPPTSLVCVTVLGTSLVRSLMMASEAIFTDPVICQRRQTGCVRFSYVPEGSVTPRRFRCQPDTALDGVADADKPAVLRRLAPAFTSRRYGTPAYGQLLMRSAPEIRTGAENGAEMGAYNYLMQPQRESNLRIRLQEYLPFGLEPGMIYVS
ncbi:MAG TPA: hypothetical protein VFI08_05790, partial [Spirochaetia bacterium]|nr:hypothetical protein [Spirochaetia bacterium]